jgi:hypothetical protein
MALEVIAIQEVPLGRGVARIGDRLIDLEVISPTSQLEALVTGVARQATQVFERQIGKLTSEERDGASHARVSLRADSVDRFVRPDRFKFDVAGDANLSAILSL